jgi:threonine dehydratase
MMAMIADITPAAVASVAEQIGPYIRRTPVLTIDRAELGLAPGPLALKLEQLQHSGSFKVRGAFANLLLRTIPPAGVVAASGGNHGAAVAFAARSVGVPAKIFVPEVSSPAKVARIRSYGADLVVGGASYHEARAASEDWAATSGALQVPAFDQRETILGAGSLGLELHEQLPASAAVLASVGGGGLLAGICAGYPGPAAIIGVEPAGAPTLTRALAAGRPVDAEVGSVAVDSLAPRQIGARNFPVLRDRVREVLLVSDAEIGSAQELLWDRLRLVGEPGGCTALAAVLSGRFTPDPDGLVTVVVSGANTTAVDFSR